MVSIGRHGRVPLLVIAVLGLAACEGGTRGSPDALAALSIFAAGAFFFLTGSLLLGRLFQRRSRRRPRHDHW